jgi:hypothetical protein
MPEKDECPRAELHTKCPEGYLEWHAWAERKSKTHTPKRCPGCGLYAIWVPRKNPVGAASSPAERL